MRIRNAVKNFSFSAIFRGKGDSDLQSMGDKIDPENPKWIDQDKWGDAEKTLLLFIDSQEGYWKKNGGPDGEDWFELSYTFTLPPGYWKNRSELDFIRDFKLLRDVDKKEGNSVLVEMQLETENEYFDECNFDEAIEWFSENCFFPLESAPGGHRLYTLYESPNTDQVFIDVPSGEKIREQEKNTIFLAKDVKRHSTIKTFVADVAIRKGGQSPLLENINKYGNKEIFEDRRKWREENLSQPELEYIKKREPDFANV